MPSYSRTTRCTRLVPTMRTRYSPRARGARLSSPPPPGRAAEATGRPSASSTCAVTGPRLAGSAMCRRPVVGLG
jgi:hypothetical protein